MIPELIDHFWQSTLFVAGAWLIILGLRKNRAQVRYWIWLAASVKFLIPFSLFVWIGTQSPWQTASPAAQIEWIAAVDQIRQPLSAPAVAVQAAVVAQAASRSYLSLVVLALWVCGFAAVGIHWLIRWRRVRSLRRSAVALQIAVADEVAVQVMSSRTLLEPGVFGLFRPVLLLPDGIMQRLDSAQLDAILEHELCHVRRKDNLTAALHMVVEAIFWFHPLVWWLGARLVDERERACDEEVLRRGGDPSVYAEGILNVCKFYVESPLVCVSGVTGSNLKKRIEAIMKNRVLHNMTALKKMALAFATIAAVAIPLAIGIAQEKGLPGGRLAFEVASVKPAPRGGGGGTKGKGGGAPAAQQLSRRFYVQFSPVMFLIYRAYDIRVCNSPQCPWVKGGPSWIKEDTFEIDAKVPDNFPEYAPPAIGARGEPAHIQQMLQSLLADRFGLQIHRETSEAPVYALTVGKDGPKLKPSDESDPRRPVVIDAPGSTPGTTKLLGRKASMATIVAALNSSSVDRPVIDRTGLQGTFDFGPEAERDETAEGLAAWTPYLEQLGLKIEATKAPVEILMIDRVQRPSEN